MRSAFIFAVLSAGIAIYAFNFRSRGQAPTLKDRVLTTNEISALMAKAEAVAKKQVADELAKLRETTDPSWIDVSRYTASIIREKLQDPDADVTTPETEDGYLWANVSGQRKKRACVFFGTVQARDEFGERKNQGYLIFLIFENDTNRLELDKLAIGTKTWLANE